MTDPNHQASRRELLDLLAQGQELTERIVFEKRLWRAVAWKVLEGFGGTTYLTHDEIKAYFTDDHPLRSEEDEDGLRIWIEEVEEDNDEDQGERGQAD